MVTPVDTTAAGDTFIGFFYRSKDKGREDRKLFEHSFPRRRYLRDPTWSSRFYSA